MDQTIPCREEDDGPCLVALTAFASSGSSMTASSEAEGTVSSGGAPSTVVAILFYFYLVEKRSRCTGGCYVTHVIHWAAIRHVFPNGRNAIGLSVGWIRNFRRFVTER